MDNILRVATIRMPGWGVLWTGIAWHVLNQVARRFVFRQRDVEVFEEFWPRVMGQFDSLAPKYAHVHDYEEVEMGFRSANCSDIRRLDRRTAVSERRPEATREQRQTTA